MAQRNNAKFAYFYLLSLISLVFSAISVGIIVFQIINKNIVDVLADYSARYNSSALKFAIASLVIAAPIYYFIMYLINKNLYNGSLQSESQIRKWLTYTIMMAASIVMVGWLIALIFNFLEGELSLKFALKSLTAVSISAIIFSYYLYDIRRVDFEGKVDGIVRLYRYGTMVIVLVSLISAFIFVESPAETRDRKFDNNVLSDFEQLHGAIEIYYNKNEKLPAKLEDVKDLNRYLREEDFSAPGSDKQYEYKSGEDKTYELCALFRTSNKEANADFRNNYYKDRWKHDAGYQCISQIVIEKKGIDDLNREEQEPIPVQ